MEKVNRIQITPKGALLKVEPRLRKKFLEEAVEVVMAEGRYKEIVNRIITGFTGLTQSELNSEATTVTPTKTTIQKKQNATLPVVPTALEPDPDTSYANCVKMLQDPESIPSSILSIVNKYDGKIEWPALIEELDLSYDYCDTDGRLDALLQMLCSNGRLRVNGEGDNRCICITGSSHKSVQSSRHG